MRQRFSREFYSYLDLAKSYTAPRQPLIIITHGFSGSGKTTGTQPMIEVFRAIRVRADVERKRLFGLNSTSRTKSAVDSDIYTGQATRQIYDELGALSAAVIRAGYSVIVDATFLRRSHRDEFRRLADELGVNCLIVDFQTRQAELRNRISRRQQSRQDASEADLAVLNHQQQTHELLGQDELALVIAVDSEDAKALSLLTASIRCRCLREWE